MKRHPSSTPTGSSHLKPKAQAALALVALLWTGGSAAAQSPALASGPLPTTIPIFPLPDLALFPNSVQPFHIFEPRYREMIADALAGDSVIGMVMLQPGYEDDYEGRPPIFLLGCAGVIVASELLPDGRYNIALRGVAKFRVLGEDQSRAYRLADVEALSESAVSDPEQLASRRRQLEAAVRSAFPRAPLPSPAVADARAIDDLSILLPLEPAERLEVLEADGPLERAATLVRLLRRGSRA
jgi:hypothetical protein